MTSLKLCTYGDHPHALGLQRLTRHDAQTLVAQYNSLRGRLARRFGGLPIYIGHPDEPRFAGHPGHTDTRAHGWVTGLEAADDGLYIRVKWARTGQDLLANAHYKFLSPRWAVEEVAPKVYVPTRLLSVGLTNHPNILGETIANQPPAAPAPELSSELAALQEQLLAERQARADLLLDQAEREGRLPPHLREEWQQSFANDFEDALASLATLRPGLPASRFSLALGSRKTATQPGRLLDRVHARMESTGEDFPTAWRRLRPSFDT